MEAQPLNSALAAGTAVVSVEHAAPAGADCGGPGC